MTVVVDLFYRAEGKNSYGKGENDIMGRGREGENFYGKGMQEALGW